MHELYCFTFEWYHIKPKYGYSFTDISERK